MPLHQITIIGTGLIGGSVALGLKEAGFRGKIVGCDRPNVLAKAKKLGVIDEGFTDPVQSSFGSGVVVLAAPVGMIISLIDKLAPHLSAETLLTDVGSTKAQIVETAQAAFGARANQRFLAGHPMAGKENSGVEHADGDLFRGAVWFFTPLPKQRLNRGKIAEYISCIKKLGVNLAYMSPPEHDQLCAWISHVPQMISTAVASTLVEEYGKNAPLLETGGRALREMTRTASSPYSMWRDIALTNRKHIGDALHKLEQKLERIRENLDSRELEKEFEQAHALRSHSPRRHGGAEKDKSNRPPSTVRSLN
jgi:prephenate dehydrogenase